MSKQKKRMLNSSSEPLIIIPASALRCILKYPKEKKIICEISTVYLKKSELKSFNGFETRDVKKNYTEVKNLKHLQDLIGLD